MNIMVCKNCSCPESKHNVQGNCIDACDCPGFLLKKTLRDAANTLVTFVRTAPGPLPSYVQEAIDIIKTTEN